MDDKKLIRTKTRYGVDLMGAQILFEDKAWTVCALAKQEYRNNFIWQWWIVMPDKNLF